MVSHNETIFLAYVAEDEAIVARLAQELRNMGAVVWRDRESIDPGVPWEEAIRKAIEESTYFAPCFSRQYSSRDSTYMNRELRLACGLASAKSSVWLLPILLDGDPAPQFADERQIVNQVQHIRMWPEWAEGLRRLAEATLQRTKKQFMEILDRQAAQLMTLELRLFRAQRMLIYAEVDARFSPGVNASPSNPGIVRNSIESAVRSMSSAAAEFSTVQSDLVKQRTLYTENVEAFRQKYKESYHPYSALAEKLEEKKLKLGEAMDRERDEARRGAMKVLLVIAALVILVPILFGMLRDLFHSLLAAIAKWWAGA